MPSDEVIEAAARAIHRIEYPGPDGVADSVYWSWDGEGTSDWHRDYCRKLARAALAAADAGLRAAVSRVRELHHKNPEPLFGEDFCACCGKDWPCPTVRALDGDS